MKFSPADRVARCEMGLAVHSAETSNAMHGYKPGGKHPAFSSFGKLVDWIGYWAASGSCNFGAVNSVADMAEARKWCPALNGAATSVSDVEMFASLVEWRACRAEQHRFNQTAQVQP